MACVTNDPTFWVQGYAANFNSDPLFHGSDATCHRGFQQDAVLICLEMVRIIPSSLHRSQAVLADCSLCAWALLAIVCPLELPAAPNTIGTSSFYCKVM